MRAWAMASLSHKVTEIEIVHNLRMILGHILGDKFLSSTAFCYELHPDLAGEAQQRWGNTI